MIKINLTRNRRKMFIKLNHVISLSFLGFLRSSSTMRCHLVSEQFHLVEPHLGHLFTTPLRGVHSCLHFLHLTGTISTREKKYKPHLVHLCLRSLRGKNVFPQSGQCTFFNKSL